MANEPAIFLEGIRLPSQPFLWSLVPGPMPFQTRIKIDNNTSDVVKALNNPVSLEVQAFYAFNGRTLEKKTLKIENLILHEPLESSEFHTFWTISDARYLLRGKKAFIFKNMTRIRNEKGTLAARTNEKIGKLNIAQLRQPFDTFKRGRYLTNSVTPDRIPFKMSEILEQYINSLGLNLDISKLKDGGDYVSENVIFEGEDVYQTLGQLLIKSRLQMGIKLNGDLTLYSLDDFDEGNLDTIFNAQGQTKVTQAKIFKRDLSRIRPKKVKVIFEKINEVRISATTPSESKTLSFLDVGQEPARPKQSEAIDPEAKGVITLDDVIKRRALSCINVIRVPFVPSTANVQLNIGEYFPLHAYLKLVDITEEEIRKLWWSSHLETFYNKKIGGVITDVRPLARMVISAIRGHYRQVFRVDPAHMDNIKELQGRRCTVIDNFSGMRPPSPL